MFFSHRWRRGSCADRSSCTGPRSSGPRGPRHRRGRSERQRGGVGPRCRARRAGTPSSSIEVDDIATEAEKRVSLRCSRVRSLLAIEAASVMSRCFSRLAKCIFSTRAAVARRQVDASAATSVSCHMPPPPTPFSRPELPNNFVQHYQIMLYKITSKCSGKSLEDIFEQAQDH